MPLPNLLIIGAPRAGTTMLRLELQRHPDIFMSPRKEPLFFAVEGLRRPFVGPCDNQGIRDRQTYRSLFAGVCDEKVIGEASPMYLYSPQAPAQIKHYLPDVKLIAILRNPIDRAYSHFLLHRLLKYEPLPGFREAILEIREQEGWSPFFLYREIGLYGEQLQRYRSIFQPEQMRVLLFEDWQQKPKEVIAGILRFLDLDRPFAIRIPPRYSVAGVPQSERLHRFLTEPNFISTLLKPFLSEATRRKLWLNLWDKLLRRVRQWNLYTPSLPLEDRCWLIDYYRDDVLRTQEMVGRDLGHWLSIPTSFLT